MNGEQYTNQAYARNPDDYHIRQTTSETGNQQYAEKLKSGNHQNGAAPGDFMATTSVQGRREPEVKRRKSILKRISNAIIKALETAFYTLGLTVARHPKKTIVIVVVVCLLLGIGLIKYKTNEDLTALLIPTTSRVHYARDWVDANVPYEFRIVQYLIVDDNVMSKESVLAMYDIWKTSYTIRRGGLGLEDICFSVNDQCLVSSLLDLWKYNETVIQGLTDEDIREAVNTTKVNPTFYTEFNASALLRDRTVDANGRIVGARAAMMSWRLLMNASNEDMVKEFEDRMVEMSENGHAGLDHVYAYTVDLFDDDFFSSVYDDLLLLIYGFPLVFIYMFLAFGKPNMVENNLFLVIAALSAVPLAGCVCYGICLAAGLDFGATHQALLFLLLAIGVDDAFVIVESWKHIAAENPDVDIEEKLALTMKHAGVSITVTSISDFAAFAAGISTLMPILSSFCVYSCVGVLALFAIQSTLFPACLLIEQKRILNSRNGFLPCIKHENHARNRFSDIEVIRPFFEKIYSPILISVPAKIIVIIATLATLGVMTWSLTQTHVGFDIARGVDPSTPARKYIDASDIYYKDESAVFQVFCDTMDYPANVKKIEDMLERYQNSSAVRHEYSESWLQPFKDWIQLIISQGEIVTLDSDGFPDRTEDFNRLLYRFLHKEPYGAAYKYYVHITNDTEFTVDFTIYNMVQSYSFDSRQNEIWLDEIRHIADTSGTTGTCLTNGPYFLFIEVIKYVDNELLRNFILAGAAVFVVTLLLIVDFRTSIYVLLCVIFTTIDLGGVLSFWGFYMDGNVVILLTFSVGLSVDFSAHVGYMFMTVTGTRDERARKTLNRIGPAVFHGAFSTFLGFLVLVFAKSYTLYIFFATFVTVVAFGLFHGLCFLPVVLSLIGPPPYDNAVHRETEYNDSIKKKTAYDGSVHKENAYGDTVHKETEFGDKNTDQGDMVQQGTDHKDAKITYKEWQEKM